jgi:CheY-like chemotaxis protein
LSAVQKDDKLSVIPVIVLTARDPQSSERTDLQAGAAAFFTRP